MHLLDEGNTIPFIARYRKELHGAMDDQILRALEERLEYLRGLEERREEVKYSIDRAGQADRLELAAAIEAAKTLAEVEDIYRPYKQKRRTRATIAKEKGLEPLAMLLFAQERACPRPEEAARDYVDPEKGVETARTPCGRKRYHRRAGFRRRRHPRRACARYFPSGPACEQGREGGRQRLSPYYDSTSRKSLRGTSVLAINRGEKEGILKVSVTVDAEQALPLYCACAQEARLRRDGIVKCGRRGRLRPSHLPLARTRGAKELTERPTRAP